MAYKISSYFLIICLTGIAAASNPSLAYSNPGSPAFASEKDIYNQAVNDNAFKDWFTALVKSVKLAPNYPKNGQEMHHSPQDLHKCIAASYQLYRHEISKQIYLAQLLPKFHDPQGIFYVKYIADHTQ